MERSSLAIIIPAFNEAKTISKIVKKCFKYGEVIVINDSSSDETAIKAKESGAIVLNNSSPNGYDKALNTGFNYALKKNYSFIITIDGDGQHDTRDIPFLITKLKSGFDMVIGNRNKKSRLGEYLFSFYTRIFWGINDPLSGYKAYTFQLCKKIGYFDSYNSIGTEILFFSLKNGFKVSEYDIKIKSRKGQSRFGSFLKADLKIIRALIISFFKTYNQN